MPSNPRGRRARIPRRLPPRPVIGTGAGAVTDEPAQPRTRAQADRYLRSSRLIERETPYVMRELRRVAGVSVVTFGLLAILAVLQRIRG
jgi:hypothetical protein